MTVISDLDLAQQNMGAFIGGVGKITTEGQLLESFNPATGDLIGTVMTAMPKDYETILEASQQAAVSWAQVPAPQRGEMVRRLGELLRKNKDRLGSLISLEMGKSKQEGDGEVQEMIDMADFAVGQSRMLYGLTIQSERYQHRLYEQWQPLGCVGVITAFNFPMAVWAWNAFLAAICGDVVIWKPSSKTPLCAIAVQQLCDQVMKEMGYEAIFSLFISSNRDLINQFVQDKRVPLISFTGSTATGREVAQKVSARLGKSLLELGGNNAVIVDKTADLRLAIPAIVFGAVGTAGQRCTSTRRLFIHKDIYNTVLEKLQNAYSQLKIGDPLNQHNHVGPIIDQAAVDNYLVAISDCKSLGANILCGGKVVAGNGYFVEPTLVEARNEWAVVQRETFAPILYIMPFATIEEAIEKQNGVSQGLSSSLFTQSISVQERFLSAVGSDCGIAGINVGTSGAEIGGAFGGEKDTGGGRESGSDSWKVYMRRQTTTINWGTELPLSQGIQFNLE